MSLGNRKVVQIDHNFINNRHMHHHLIVHLRPKTKLSIMVRIHRTSRLEQPSPKAVCHMEVVGLLHVVGVVETKMVSVVMASQVACSAVKRVTL